MKLEIKPILAIIVGSAIMGFGINCFNISNGLTEGGITGITILLKLLFNWDPGLVNLLINIPLMFLGWKTLGRTAFIYMIVGTVSLSVFLSVFEIFSLPLHDPLLASLYAGVSVGIGLGIVFRFGGATDGIDIIAHLLNKYMGLSIGRTMFFSDLIVVAISLIYLDLTRAMYTLVAVFIGAKVIDYVQETAYKAKAVMIISNATAEISKKITMEMERGVTILNGKGGYTGESKEVLYCVVNRNEIGRLKILVQGTDPCAFVSVNDVYEVLGKGFTDNKHLR
ncbi:YitT family protein [Priestia megaterium]|uniref:YitT family protein n=1 Tax=Priestia megaterium TaxID=1404 RepID=A0A6H1NZ27_PRIMG|nr:YitT family protein [Priestia megaterium]QIZ06482.1 YitT family protein [Priestia megaterium]